MPYAALLGNNNSTTQSGLNVIRANTSLSLEEKNSNKSQISGLH